MDTVTAAGLVVDVDSIAAALGEFTIARTVADTYVNVAKRFGIGLTIGEAFACCGEGSQVQVGSAVMGGGDPVSGTTHSAEHDGIFLAYGFSIGLLLAGLPPQSMPAVGQALESFHNGLADQGRGLTYDMGTDTNGLPATTNGAALWR